MVVYTPAEIYRLYQMFKEDKWNRLSLFFFGKKKEPASARDTFDAIDRTQKIRISRGIDRPTDLYGDKARITSKGILWMMYYEPYEKMPLFVNQRGYNVIARWRLKLGK